MKMFLCQVEVKRTVPREATEFKGASRIKKIFVGGLPPSLSNGGVVQPYFSNLVFYGSFSDYTVTNCR